MNLYRAVVEGNVYFTKKYQNIVCHIFKSTEIATIKSNYTKLKQKI